MKADRLLSILLLLQTRNGASAPELARRLEVSVRTIYRDIEALSAAGVPVWVERGRTGGVRLLPGYRTDVPGLTGDEARALFVLTADGAYEELGLGTAIGSALRKVMAALPAGHRPAAELTSERILVDPVRWKRGDGAAEVDLGTLQQAVFADRRLRLSYRRSGETTPRDYTVDPYGLVNKAGVWYLVADRDGEPRLFRADRVAAAEVSDEPVRRRRGHGLAEVWATLRERVERTSDAVRVTCRVRQELTDMFLRIQAANVAAAPVPRDGGWTEVELAFPALRAVRALLAFGPDVEVLEPPEARAELASAAAAVVGLYAPEPGGGGRAGDL
ncbi:helix-turn-helix transcriptional regulator [Streptomyces sennicomposti]|uniref:helix-turn-helix transcriptional regulator n=1 Tax=Streptomyces TaxID=1883 RepID=UPI001CA74A96|nr:WYL domain-containing protein [Streptomyces sennicomposti]MBY8865675.1 WYL domain-containing protein [Streptomyces sennicomposti]